MDIRSILSAFGSSLERIATMRRILLESVPYARRYPALIDALSRQCLSAVRDARFFYGEIIASIRRATRTNPPTPLEALEAAFVGLREQAEAAEVAARKMARVGGRVAKRTRRIADELHTMTRKAATTLVAEAQRRGADMDWFVREYGLDNWLRG